MQKRSTSLTHRIASRSGPRPIGRIRPFGDRLLARSPLQPLFLWRASRQLAVLAYHGVEEPHRFEAQLGELRRTASLVSLPEALDALAGRRGLPRRAVLLTFDDGARSLVENALPILRASEAPAVAFPVAGVIGTDEPFWWTEVKHRVEAGAVTGVVHGPRTAEAVVRELKTVPDEARRRAMQQLRATSRTLEVRTPQIRSEDLVSLQGTGVEIGNHTFSHPCLSRCSDGQVDGEIREADHVLSRWVGERPRVFAYPHGQYDSRAERVLRELEYEAAFLFDHRLATVPAPHRLRVSRLRVDSGVTVNRLKIITSGLHPALHRMRGGT